MMEFKRVLISGNALVVAFDMCSSSDMLEELILRDDTAPYNYVIGQLKHHLAAAQKWILNRPGFRGGCWG